MSKVFAQLAPKYNGKITCIEVDVNLKENFSLIDKYRVMTIPTSILLDNVGSVKDKETGFIPIREMQEKLDEI